MKQYTIKFSKDARKDFTSTVKYIKERLKEPNTAKQLAKQIQENIYKLKNNPEIYAVIEDELIKKFQVRKIIVKNYIVFYKVDKQEIQIIRILYARRNWINLI